MNWTELIIKVDVKDLETASAIAQMSISNGIYVEDYSELSEDTLRPSEIIDDDLLNKDRDRAKIHVYINPETNPNETILFIKDRLISSKIRYELTVDSILDDAWATNWKKHFKPLNISERIVVKPSWEEYKNDKKDKVIIEIDPGMAFGSGTHESTKLCLQGLDKYIGNSELVLDIGCGSGILSIASLLLGAKNVVSVDVDPLAVKVTNENMKLNSISSERYKTYEGNLLTSSELVEQIGFEEYDIVLANIVADIIIEYAPLIKKQLKTNGILITSGIINDRKNDVIKAMEALDFSILETDVENEWSSVICKKTI